jgi:excisionase family DNA binding protein
MATKIALNPINKVPAVAEYLDCDRGTVYLLIQRGDLRAVRLGRNLRVTREAVEEFLGGR